VLTQLQPISVIFVIPEDDVEKVWPLAKAGEKLTVTAYNRSDSKAIATGTLESFDNEIDTTTGTVRLKASFPNDDYSLFPNQFVNVKLLVGTDRNVVLIPTAAIQRSALGTFVYVVKPDSTVEVRKVDLATTEGDTSSVLSGVTPGEQVVVEGVDRLQQGSKVRIRVASNSTPASRNDLAPEVQKGSQQ
jgi:membrane fusion protein, multidrug efflux system